MKTRNQIIRELYVYREHELGSLDNLLFNYGAEVREECAKIAKESKFKDGPKGTIEGQIATAIRTLELP